jgi:hypothetical protein
VSASQKLHTEWVSMREDRYKPDFIPSEHPGLPADYYATIVVEVFRQKFLQGFNVYPSSATLDWPLEWFIAVEMEEGVYGKDKSLMHLVDHDEDGKPTPTDETMRLLGAAYKSKLYGVANPFGIPEDYSEAKPWDDEPGHGLVLDDIWTYPMVEMLLDLKPGRGRSSDFPQVGYQLFAGYEDGGTIDVAPVVEPGEVFEPDADMLSVPAVDVVMALFGPQKPKRAASKYAPTPETKPGKYDLYQVQRVKIPKSDIEPEIHDARIAMGHVEAEARQLLGVGEAKIVNDSAAWIADREEGRAARWSAPRTAGKVVFTKE